MARRCTRYVRATMPPEPPKEPKQKKLKPPKQPKAPKPKLPIEVVTENVLMVSGETGIPVDVIFDGHKLERSCVAARRRVIKLLADEEIYSLRSIGDAFGISKVQVHRHLQKAN